MDRSRLILSELDVCSLLAFDTYVQIKLIMIYRMVQTNVYDRVLTNSLIDFFGYILFLYLYIDNSFLANMFLKLIEIKLL